MPRIDSTFSTLVIAAVLAAGVGYGVNEWTEARKLEQRTSSLAAVAQTEPAKPRWAASAPGRVEPRGGELRLTAQGPGRVAAVLVGANDRVAAGEVLILLDEDEARARLAAAEAAEAARRRDRDEERVTGLAADRRAAEDALANAERSLHAARIELDRLFIARRKNGASQEEVDRARSELAAAADRVRQASAELGRVSAQDGMPRPTRLEAALAQARAELRLAEIAFDRTRVRSPIDGTVLDVNVKAGEMLAPSPDAFAVSIGDLTALRVRAEVEERDISKIRVGQRVVVNVDAYPGRDFQGRVSSIASHVAPPRLGSRGPRKPTDVDVLEVLIDLDGRPPLFPGMRADVFFVADVTSGVAPLASAN